MDFYDILLAKKLSGGGGGGSATLIEKSISANGVYNASDDSADGYSKATVDVPNSYAAGDEGKVVSNGALVSQISATYTENNTYDTTLVDSVTVNVSGDDSLKAGYPLTLMSGTGIVYAGDNKIYLDENYYKTRKSLWLTEGTIPVGWYYAGQSENHGTMNGVYAIPRPNNTTKINVICGTSCYIYFNELDTSNNQTPSGWLNITANTKLSFNLQNSTDKILINFKYDSDGSNIDRGKVINKAEVSFE